MIQRCLLVIGLISLNGLFPTAALAFDYFQPLPKTPLVPENNPLSAEKIALGKKLFYDPDLSKSRRQSCNTCHNLLTGGDDDRGYSINQDGKPTKRSAPGLWNIGLQTVLYWDGRAKTLEAQAKDHLLDKNIMAMSAAGLQNRLKGKAKYRAGFKKAFNGKINLENIAKALASFQRALLAPDSPFDRYLKGDKDAISEMAKKGMQVFNNTGCLACHFGTNFAGPAPGPAMGMGDGFYELFPNNLGSRYDKELGLLKDKGRYEFTKADYEKYMWRVPPLRNIALTGPYFHNGSAKTLDQAIRVMAKTQFNKELKPEELAQIAAFLRSLTGQRPKILD